MVDGVVLLVDIIEGPKTQTKFVLQKALKHPKMRPLVVINKVDRPMMRDKGEVENDIFDIFATMASADEQFPILIILIRFTSFSYLATQTDLLRLFILFDGFKRSHGVVSSYVLIHQDHQVL
jgi:predicted membrane GTPase involved in stress response